MSKDSFARFTKKTKNNLMKHSPEILTGLGIAGMISTVVLAVKATPKAIYLIDEGVRVKNEGSDSHIVEDLKPVEIVKVAWKPYIPAMLTCGASIACLIGANTVNARRNAAIATAYELSRNAFSEYKERVVEEIGKEKEEKIQEKVAQKTVERIPVNSEVIVTGGGSVLFLDPVSERYFESDVETIRKIINDLNYRLINGSEEYVSLSEFYDEVGLSHTSISNDIGWNINQDGQIAVSFPATKTTDGKPCLMLDFHVAPRYDYSKLS